MFFFLMLRRPPRSTRMTHSFPTRRSSDFPMRRIERSAEQAGTNHSDIRLGRSRKPRESWGRSEEHTSELQPLMRISYAVFGVKKKNIQQKSGRARHHNRNAPTKQLQLNHEPIR